MTGWLHLAEKLVLNLLKPYPQASFVLLYRSEVVTLNQEEVGTFRKVVKHEENQAAGDFQIHYQIAW